MMFTKKTGLFIKTLPLIIILYSSIATSEGFRLLHLDPLHVSLPSAWVIDDSRKPIEGRGPNNEKLLITVLRKSDIGSSKPTQEFASDFANGKMKKLGSKDNQTVIRDISKFPVSEGKTGYSMVSEESNFIGSQKFFIQYIFASTSAIIYFTIEGRGKAEPIMLEFDQYFKNLYWDEED